MTPLAIIQHAYADFSRGDIPAILSRLSPEVVWAANVDPSLPEVANVPCYERGCGRTFVAAYFQKFSAGYEVHQFDIQSMLAGGREVAVRLAIDVTIRRTGKRLRTEVIHHWILNENGEVTRFLDVEDTHAFVHAWSKEG